MRAAQAKGVNLKNKSFIFTFNIFVTFHLSIVIVVGLILGTRMKLCGCIECVCVGKGGKGWEYGGGTESNWVWGVKFYLFYHFPRVVVWGSCFVASFRVLMG